MHGFTQIVDPDAFKRPTGSTIFVKLLGPFLKSVGAWPQLFKEQKHTENKEQQTTHIPTQNTTKNNEGMISRTSLTRMPSKGQMGQRFRNITWAILEIMWSMVFVK